MVSIELSLGSPLLLDINQELYQSKAVFFEKSSSLSLWLIEGKVVNGFTHRNFFRVSDY
jgi:hypothetical protein